MNLLLPGDNNIGHVCNITLVLFLGNKAVSANTYYVRHDAELVQGRLPIEEHNVAIDQVPFYQVAQPQLLSNLLAVSIL